MNTLKRKTTGSASPAPGPSTPTVKMELAEEGKKRRIASQLSSANNVVLGAMDPRTALVHLRQQLKSTITMNYQLAWFHVEQFNPGLNIAQVLEDFKNVERVTYNDQNSVYTYTPELVISNIDALRNHIRNNSTPTTGLSVKLLREAMPDNGLTMLEKLEATGDIIIMRGLGTEAWKNCGLPALGKASKINGLKVNESGVGGGAAGSRMKTVWWDLVKERGRSGARVEDEFIFAWDAVRIEENDDVAQLLRDQELSASSAPPPPPKVTAGPTKKKRQNRRAIKITNTHMLDQGIDLSRDYEAPA